MTPLHRLLWLTLLWAMALPATAADRLAVLELTGSAASEEVMIQLSDKLRSGALEAARSSDLDLDIMTRESMAAILGDMGVDAACVEGQCEVETARNLQAAYVISGSLVQLEGQYIVTTKLHSAASGSLLSTEEALSASLLDLRSGVQASGARLLTTGLGLTPSSLVVAGAGSPIGESSIDLDGDNVDFAKVAAAANAARLKRERLEAEQQRAAAEQAARLQQIADEEARLQAAMAAEKQRRLTQASAKLLDRAAQDFAAVEPLMDQEPTPETRPVIEAFVARYQNARVSIDDQTQSVTVPSVTAALAWLGNRFVYTGERLSMGSGHACVVQADSTASCAGSNTWGQTKPQQTTGGMFQREVHRFKSVSAGDILSCGVLNRYDTAVCWGKRMNAFSKLFPSSNQIVNPPTDRFLSVSAGWGYACGITTNREVKCWGSGDDTIFRGGNFLQVSLNRFAWGGHACAVTVDNRIECVEGHRPKQEKNQYGEASPPAGQFSFVSVGEQHSCGIRDNATVECWGGKKNVSGLFPEIYAQRHPATAATKYRSLSAGRYHTCAVSVDGRVDCWGSNRSGESTPPSISAVAVSAGSWRTCAVTTDDEVVCWGRPLEGRSATSPFGRTKVKAAHR